MQLWSLHLRCSDKLGRLIRGTVLHLRLGKTPRQKLYGSGVVGRLVGSQTIQVPLLELIGDPILVSTKPKGASNFWKVPSSCLSMLLRKRKWFEDGVARCEPRSLVNSCISQRGNVGQATFCHWHGLLERGEWDIAIAIETPLCMAWQSFEGEVVLVRSEGVVCSFSCSWCVESLLKYYGNINNMSSLLWQH